MLHGQSQSQKEAFWENQFAAWRKSGLSQREFCERNGLSLNTFNCWRRRCRELVTKPSVEIVPLVQTQRIAPLPLVTASSKQAKMSLVIGDRYRVELQDEFSRVSLSALLDVLEERVG